MDNLSGSVERITFYNPENGYTVLRLRPEVRGSQHLPGLSFDGLVTVVGNLPELTPGEHLRIQGVWDNHPKHGKQFKAEVCEQVLPSTVAGMESYLGSGMVKGIGPKLAERIVGHFREATFEIIEKKPERLLEVPGIGQDRTGKIMVAWQEQKQVKEIMLFLHSHGVSTNLAVKIYKTYGDTALAIVQENPYQLERDIYGVGFKTADRIAQALGLAPEHPSRIEAGIVFALNEMVNDGHVYAPREMLVQRATELLGISAGLIPPGFDRLAQDERIRPELIPVPGKTKLDKSISEAQATYETSVIYLTPLYFGEKGVAERIKALAGANGASLTGQQLSFPVDELSEEQRCRRPDGAGTPRFDPDRWAGHGQDHLPESPDCHPGRAGQILCPGFPHRTGRQTTLGSHWQSGQHHPSPAGILAGGRIQAGRYKSAGCGLPGGGRSLHAGSAPDQPPAQSRATWYACLCSLGMWTSCHPWVPGMCCAT